MSEFRADDARLAGMQGYVPVKGGEEPPSALAEYVTLPMGRAGTVTCPTCGEAFPWDMNHVCRTPSMQIATKEDVQRVQATLDGLIKALREHGVL